MVSRPISADEKVKNEEVFIAVMGATGTGKTTFINLASGSDLRVGAGLLSCTDTVQSSRPFEFQNRLVTLIDTPGFDDTTKSDGDILKMIAVHLALAYERGTKLHGVIYMHRISDTRMSGISRRNFILFQKVCGTSSLKNVILVTNMWGNVDEEVAMTREQELRDSFFGSSLEKGAELLRHHNTQASAYDILALLVNKEPTVLRIQHELVDDHKDILETAAGREVNRELLAQAHQHQEELEALKKKMEEEMEKQNDDVKHEWEAKHRELQSKMSEAQQDSGKLAAEYQQEKEHLNEKMKEMEEDVRRGMEESAARYEWERRAMQDRLRDVSNRSDAETAQLRAELEEIRRAHERRQRERQRSRGCIIQ